ncbi:hypothetical protein A9993_24860 [Rahnella victoriana]|uniref:hypothetical protein n=1 Tax=Rahnella victoriana TaxID=1510570 RepID=UPI000BB193DE|nr:hypothetical protein [Rahnella victoriana]PBI78066.1 hypothetical protein A9993_24860 [Rahnella victoriana]
MPYGDNGQGLFRRGQLEQQIIRTTKFSIYAQAVYCVNRMLREANVGISEQAYQSISRNITAVTNGRLYETSASLSEARVFARDTVAAITASGVAINAIGGPLFFGHYDRNKLIAIERHLYDNFHL